MEKEYTRGTLNELPVSISTPHSAHLGRSGMPGPALPRHDPKDLAGLVHFNRARHELEMATAIDEVRDIRDKAEAMRVYAQQAKCSLEMQNMCAEIKLRAERRIGEMLRESGISERKQANLLRGRVARLREDAPSLDELGISKRQSSQWQLLSTMREEQFEERINRIKESGRELTTKELAFHAKALQKEEARAEKREKGFQAVEKVHPDERVRILHGDFREVLGQTVVPTNSVDLLLTDPPYAEKFLPLWGHLGEFAARVLKPGRLLAAYSGKYHLLDVMNLLAQNLNYVWIVAISYASSPDTVFARRIKTYWKPVLLFSKGKYDPEEKRAWLHDRIQSEGVNKAHHEWEQAIGDSLYLIENLTYEGDMVADPMVGSGTTAVACKQLNRRFLGCDVDESNVRTALSRLRESA